MSTPGPFELRRAVVGDELSVAAVHVASWRSGYRGIVPDEVLEGLDVVARAARYTFDASGPDAPATWIALAGGSVVGFATTGPCRDADRPRAGEVLAFYVDPTTWRCGVGAAMMERALRELAARGWADASLWVLEDNWRGRGFYEALGWACDGASTTVVIGGRSLAEIRYRRDLADVTPAR